MTAVKRYPIVVLERISFKLHSTNGSIDKKVGHIYSDVVVKNEPNPENLSAKSSNSGIRDTSICYVKEEVGVTTMQENAFPKREHPSIVNDLVVKIKKETEELIDYYDNGPVCAKQTSWHEVKCKNERNDSDDGNYFNSSSANRSDDDAFTTVKAESPTETSEKFSNGSQTSRSQQTKDEFCNVKLLNVSVKLQDLFPSSVRKLGKAHTNDERCPCIYCCGEFRFSSLGEFSKNEQNKTESICPQSVSPFIKTHFEPEKNLDLKMSYADSRVVAVGLHKCSAVSKSVCEPNKPEQSGCGRTMYNCTKCSAKIEGHPCFEAHLRVHSSERQFKCKLCPAKFTQMANLRSHHRKVHTNIRPFECQQCPAKFSARCALLTHSRVHSGEKPFKCPQCQRKFSRTCNMQVHVKRMHTHVKPFKCALCPGAFKQKNDLEIHLRVHTREKPYKCEQCPARFSQRGNLKTHLKVHSTEKPFKCAHCPSKFRNKEALKCHLRTHSTERLFSCAECTQKFKTKYELKRHLLGIHSTDRPFQCKQCPARFKRGSTLWAHSRVAHSDSKPFKCSLCGSRFKLSSALRTHMLRHNKERAFKCDQCQGAFKSKNELVVHVRIHTGERPFRCHHCPASFVQNCQLRKHIKLHTGDGPFKCGQCCANFSQSFHLRIHVKKTHGCELSSSSKQGDVEFKRGSPNIKNQMN